MTRSARLLLVFALGASCAGACGGSEGGSPDGGRDGGRADSSTLDAGADAADAPTDGLPFIDAMPPTGAFCALPGSVVYTSGGPRMVPGGAPAPSLGWLTLPPGFCAHYFGTVQMARQLRFAPDGHLFVASPTPTGSSFTTTGGSNDGLGAIVVLPDDNHDGNADTVATYLGNLPSTQGLLFNGGYLYFQDNVTIRRTAFKNGDLSPSAPVTAFTTVTVEQATEHWPKVMDVAKDGTFYLTNGSSQSQVCESVNPVFGAIFKVGTDGGVSTVATGFRNPIALRCETGVDTCLAAELSLDYSSDMGGREKIVPVHQGDDWGYPCCATTNVPYSGVVCQDTHQVPNCGGVTPESASFVIGDTPFGIAYETGKWPEPWTGRAFVTLHGVFGSWQGARVTTLALDAQTGIPLSANDLDAGASGAPNMTDFAIGWDDLRQDHGRPASVEFAPDGRLFLGDDQLGAIVWIAPVDLMP